MAEVELIGSHPDTSVQFKIRSNTVPELIETLLSLRSELDIVATPPVIPEPPPENDVPTEEPVNP